MWAGVASVMGYINPYLLDRGLTATDVGVLLALSGIGSALIQPLTGGLADRKGKPTLRTIMLAVLGIFALIAAAAAFLHSLGGMALGVVLAVATMVWGLLTPLTHAVGSAGEREGLLRYDIARGIGSVGYAAAFFAMGQFIEGRSWLVPAAMFFWAALMLVGLLTYPVPESTGGEETDRGLGLDFLRRYPRFRTLLLGELGVLLGHSVISHFALQIVQAHGGGEPQMGIALALACMTELPVMFGYGLLRKRFRAGTLLIVGAVFFTLKCALTWATGTMTGFYLVQLTQMPAWGITAMAHVQFIGEEMDPGDRVKGQTFFSMVQAAGSVIGSLIGGWLIDHAGMDALMGFATGASLLGMTAVIWAMRLPRLSAKARS